MQGKFTVQTVKLTDMQHDSGMSLFKVLNIEWSQIVHYLDNIFLSPKQFHFIME